MAHDLAAEGRGTWVACIEEEYIEQGVQREEYNRRGVQVRQGRFGGGGGITEEIISEDVRLGAGGEDVRLGAGQSGAGGSGAGSAEQRGSEVGLHVQRGPKGTGPAPARGGHTSASLRCCAAASRDTWRSATAPSSSSPSFWG